MSADPLLPETFAEFPDRVYYIEAASNGRVYSSGSSADGAVPSPIRSDGAMHIVDRLCVVHRTAYFDGQLVDIGDQPSSHHVYDYELREWVDGRPIEIVRADLMESLKRARDTRLEAGFIWDGSPFDSDTAVSQPRLLGLFTTAIAGGIPPEGYAWRLADNTWRVLSASDAVAVWGAFQAHMAGLFVAFAVHEAAVLAETDIEVLRNYDTEAGWPA